jgi:HK97 family phage portal protein
MFGDLLGYKIRPEGETAAGVDVDETTALSLSAVYQAIRILSEGLGSLPCITYKRTDDGRERAVQHPNYKLLHRRPNPEMTPMVFFRTMMSRAVGWQNAYAVIEPDGRGKPKNVWPIHPCRVTPKRTNDGTLFYEVRNEDQNDSRPRLCLR